MMYLAFPLTILAFAFLFNGFPKIRFGSKITKTINHYYSDSEDEDSEHDENDDQYE